MSKLGQNDPAVHALTTVATVASATVSPQLIVLAPPKDSALGWKAASVHPLQLLATEYQGIVNDATRGESDFARRQRIESEQMGQFFFFDAGTPRLLGVGKQQAYNGDPFPLAENALSDASKKLKKASTLAQLQGNGNQIRALLGDANAQTGTVVGSFYTLPMSDHWGVPAVDNAAAQLNNLGLQIATANTVGDVTRIVTRITAAIQSIEGALEGVGTVQMFYSIERFYLYRLLVRYRLYSDAPITPKQITDASKAVTGLVTNGHDWLSDWLSEKVVDLGLRVVAADPSGNTLFFLKGGRALYHALQTPQLGTSDWDTQIVINPELPAEQWYSIFLRVTNATLLALNDYKAELYMLLFHNAAAFENELGQVPVLNPPARPVELYAERANCKAELIDVGLPRYDTVEAREQWRMLRGNIWPYPGTGMPIPGYSYYIDEYLMMTREMFAGASPSAGKIGSRIDRLFRILSVNQVNQLAAAKAQAVQPLLPLSVNAIATLGAITQPVRNGLYWQLAQFHHAYRLEAEPRMAAQFDGFFAGNLPNFSNLAQTLYPQGVRQALVQDETAPNPTISAGCTQLADSIGFCQWISVQMQAHFTARAAALAERQELDTFYRCFEANSIFSQTEELEVQLGGEFAFGTSRFADYLAFERPQDLDPMTYMSLGIYCALPDTDLQTVLELVRPVVNQCLTDTMGTLDVEDEYPTPPDAIRVLWDQPITIAPLQAYRPLAVEITVHADPPRRPLLSYIWGSAIISLRDLILDYQDRAAGTDEYGTRVRLTATIAALSEMLMHASNVEPPNPTIAALIRGECHHLMVSSISNAVARNGEYPPSFRPARAFQLTLTPNRQAFARQFDFGGSA